MTATRVAGTVLKFPSGREFFTDAPIDVARAVYDRPGAPERPEMREAVGWRIDPTDLTCENTPLEET